MHRVTPPPTRLSTQTYEGDIAELYADILFHGLDLHGIQKITALSDEGMISEVNSAPHPDQWIKHPLRSRWIADPLILDSAFQMATIWCHEQRGMVSLPSYIDRYRQFQDRFPTDGATVILEITDTKPNLIKGDFSFIDKENRLIARLTGYEAVMDQSLYEAFKAKKVSFG